jgi:glycosyltransferase involved in cell wall biosynthesis
MADYVRHGETGLLVEPHDPAALSQAIAELWADPAAAAAMGRRAREWVRERFSLETWLEQLGETLEAV